MWRARKNEFELESKMKSRTKDRGDSRGNKRKSDSRHQSSSSRIQQEGIAYNRSYSGQEDGLGDDEIEKFLRSRVKRGRGATGSRMDEPGPYFSASSHSQKNGPSPDVWVEEKWERRVQGPERPLFLRSKSPDDYWHRETLDGEPCNSEPCNKKEKEKERSEKKDKKEKNKKKDKKSKHHHHHKSRRRE